MPQRCSVKRQDARNANPDYLKTQDLASRNANPDYLKIQNLAA
jgi:hypothetical protein